VQKIENKKVEKKKVGGIFPTTLRRVVALVTERILKK
jgi:hypothetical protein